MIRVLQELVETPRDPHLEDFAAFFFPGFGGDSIGVPSSSGPLSKQTQQLGVYLREVSCQTVTPMVSGFGAIDGLLPASTKRSEDL